MAMVKIQKNSETYNLTTLLLAGNNESKYYIDLMWGNTKNTMRGIIESEIGISVCPSSRDPDLH